MLSSTAAIIFPGIGLKVRPCTDDAIGSITLQPAVGRSRRASFHQPMLPKKTSHRTRTPLVTWGPRRGGEDILPTSPYLGDSIDDTKVVLPTVSTPNTNPREKNRWYTIWKEY